MKHILFATVATIMLAGSAHAGWFSSEVKIPVYDTQKFCQKSMREFDKLPDFANADQKTKTLLTADILGKCKELEAMALDKLTTKWPNVPHVVRDKCVNYPAGTKIDATWIVSYWVILTCIDPNEKW